VEAVRRAAAPSPERRRHTGAAQAGLQGRPQRLAITPRPWVDSLTAANQQIRCYLDGHLFFTVNES
jgi:hypothetical protein